MKTSLLDYELPPELIADRPPVQRDGGRMFVLGRHNNEHCAVKDFAEQVGPDDLLVLNETKVRKARLLCRRPRLVGGGGGGRAELLFLHPLAEGHWAALGKANRPLRPGARLLAEGVELEVVGRDDLGTLSVRVSGDLEEALQKSGMMPIPPYMDRESDDQDVERYQTVFAREIGSAAAPTAGLHMTEEMLTTIKERGARIARVTLHVGVGTFRPVTSNDLDTHPMHSEEIFVDREVCSAVEETRHRKGRVIAVGTTVVRSLESARDAERPGLLRPCSGPTRLLIQPGYEFSVVDALLTNFHQPKSTLLALVSAFAGYERTFAAYREAVQMRYRFLSYGDAMWIPARYERSEL